MTFTTKVAPATQPDRRPPHDKVMRTSSSSPETEAQALFEPTVGETVKGRGHPPDESPFSRRWAARLFPPQYTATPRGAYAPVVVYEWNGWPSWSPAASTLRSRWRSRRTDGSWVIWPARRHPGANSREDSVCSPSVPLPAAINWSRASVSAHVARLLELGFVGQYTEAVTVHLVAECRAAGGAHEGGLLLAAQSNELDFRGFDADEQVCKAPMSSTVCSNHTRSGTVYVPPTYREADREDYTTGNSRALHWSSNGRRRPPPSRPCVEPAPYETGVAVVADACRRGPLRLQQQVRQLQINRYELILVVLPWGNWPPVTTVPGCRRWGVVRRHPSEYEDGDVLVPQNPEQRGTLARTNRGRPDPGTYLRDVVLRDYQQATDRTRPARPFPRAHGPNL